MDAFHDDIEIAVADVIPGVPHPAVDEPMGLADGLRGEAAFHGSMLDRNDVTARP